VNTPEGVINIIDTKFDLCIRKVWSEQYLFIVIRARHAGRRTAYEPSRDSDLGCPHVPSPATRMSYDCMYQDVMMTEGSMREADLSPYQLEEDQIKE
jgi:hypothetical protein